MTKKKKPSKYRRCPKCRELVVDTDNCENCANRNPLALNRHKVFNGQRGRPTLDMQEKNLEELG